MVLAVVLGTIQVHSAGIGSLSALALFGAAVAATAAFVVAEGRSEAPTVDLTLFRSAQFSATLAVLLFVFFAIGLYLFFITIYLQRALHMSALLAAVALVPISLFTILLSTHIGKLGDRTTHYPLVIAGLLIFSGGLLLTASGTKTLTYVALLPAIIALGVGMALFRGPLLSLFYNSVPDNQAGMRTAISEVVGRLGGVLGVAIGVSIFLAVTTADLNARLPAAGFHHHVATTELQALWSNPTSTKRQYRALPAPARQQLFKIATDSANDALAVTLFVCAALVGGLGVPLVGSAAYRSRRQGHRGASPSSF
jgi:hypothetical protein